MTMNSIFGFSSALKNEIKWHGNHNENCDRLILKAGHLSIIYEKGTLRTVSMGNKEIIRMVQSAVRDNEWLTITPEISEEEFEICPDSFRIRYLSKYTSGEINFSAKYVIEGNSDNSLTFRFEGEALNTFQKNRIGFCVLHPIDNYAGKPCKITHSDGSAETKTFPVIVYPHQPFKDISKMSWVVDGCNCQLEFHGDIFETEDQRNWTDSSYKTYCTPLEKPFPATMKKGEKINQKIELKVNSESFQHLIETEKIVINIDTEPKTEIPSIGIGRSTRKVPLTDSEIQILNKIHFDHYRIDLCLFYHDWKVEADLATKEASTLGCSLEIALFFDDNAAIQYTDFESWLSATEAKIMTICLFHKTSVCTPDYLSENIASNIKRRFPHILIGTGTNANFAQINRNHPRSELSDLVCYSVHPQEHASDNATLVENLRAQSYTVECAKQFSGNKGIWISPVNIQRRFNANIESYESLYPDNEFPAQCDSRLMSLFGGGWAAVSLKYLIESGAKGLTYFETAGERGILQGDFSSRWPNDFHAEKGMIFPVYFVFQYLLRHKSYSLLPGRSSNPLIADCLVLTDGKQLRMILSNFTKDQHLVKITGFKGNLTVRQLNAENYAEAVSDSGWLDKAAETKLIRIDSILLNPFSVSFVDALLKL